MFAMFLLVCLADGQCKVVQTKPIFNTELSCMYQAGLEGDKYERENGKIVSFEIKCEKTDNNVVYSYRPRQQHNHM